MFCLNCGVENSNQAKFCKGCGRGVAGVQGRLTIDRPKEVSLAMKMLWAAVAIGVIVSIFDAYLSPAYVGASAFFVYMAGRGKNWARITLLVLCILTVPSAVISLFSMGVVLFGSTSIDVLVGLILMRIIFLVGWVILQVFAVILLFRKPSSDWFAAMRQLSRQQYKRNLPVGTRKSAWDLYVEAFRKYAVFSGRAQRAEYWYFVFFNSAICAFVTLIFLALLIAQYNDPVYFDFVSLGLLFNAVLAVYGLVVFLPGLALIVRRLHDTGNSGWMVLVTLIPIIGSIWFLVLMVTDSAQRENQYGQNPKMANRTWRSGGAVMTFGLVLLGGIACVAVILDDGLSPDDLLINGAFSQKRLTSQTVIVPSARPVQGQTSRPIAVPDRVVPEVSVGTEESDGFSCGTSQVKDAEGSKYRTVRLGNECWMASNLNVGKRIDVGKSPADNGKIERWCPDNTTDSCKGDNGGLYTWSEAMQYSVREGAQGICPDGWHIPTLSEYEALQNHVSDDRFDLVLAGFCYDGKCQGQGKSANFWSSKEVDSTHAKDMLVYSGGDAGSSDDISIKTNGFSVRCVKD